MSRFVRTFLWSTFCALTVVAVLNCVVNPDGTYRPRVVPQFVTPRYAGHDVVTHSIKEYARRENGRLITTNVDAVRETVRG